MNAKGTTMHERIAIAVENGNNGDAIVAEHFGGCTSFTVCELDEGRSIVTTESYVNPLAGEHGGVCQLPAYVQQFGISAVIAGGMGRKAVENFQRFGITVITAPGLSFHEAIDRYREGSLTGYTVCTHEHGHHHHAD